VRPQAPLLWTVGERLAQAEEDCNHALRWGWTPGSTTVRRFFGTLAPYAGLQWWLDAKSTRCEGISKMPYYTPSGQTPGVKEFFEGVQRSHVLLDAYRCLERES
jgi:hypothetical protein